GGGSVLALGQPGSYALPTDYGILSAAGGVGGGFGDVTPSLTIQTPELSYEDTEVFLTLLRSDVSFFSVAGTPNQRAVARALDAIGPGPGGAFQALLQALFLLDPAGARNAFEALSGMQLTHGQRVSRRSLRNLWRLSFGRLGGRGRDPGLSGVTLAFADEPLAGRLVEDFLMRLDGVGAAGDRGLWARGYGVFGDIDGDGNAAGADYTTGGLAVGLDTALGEHWTVGVSAGYGRTDVDSFGAELDVDSYQFAAYAGYRQGGWHADALVGHAWQDVDSMRPVSFGGVDSLSTAGYDLKSFSAVV